MSLTFVSSLLGEVQYEENEVYDFEYGIPAFPEHRRFMFVKVEESPFWIMHSLQDDLYFILIDPFTVFPDYEFIIPERTIEQLDIQDRKYVICYSIVVLRDPLSTSTANLVAPIVVNTSNRKGMQLVLENTNYSIRQPVFLNETAATAEKG